jgi:hypothetical protein
MTETEALDAIEAALLPPSPGQRTLSDVVREILAATDGRTETR